MLAETRAQPFTGAGWLFEIKYDGFRALAERQGEDVRIFHRGGGDATATYPDLAAALRDLPADAVLDGEIVVTDDRGHPSFQRLQQRALLTKPIEIAQAASALPALYFAFDLLIARGRDLRPLPLLDRKRLLARLLPASGPLRYVDHIEARGEDMFAAVAHMGLEGIVAKRTDAPYQAGRSHDWLKIRRDRIADFVVVGYTAPGGLRTGLGSLLLAAWSPRGLVYVGRAGSGLAERDLERLPRELADDVVPAPPCSGPVPRGPPCTWVTPRLVCEVRYREITSDGLLRQPTFLRWRPDKSMQECALPTI
jgi:bifunctional non-homologous end joining protein LigD